MTNGQKGLGSKAASLPLMALALTLAGALPARAQDTSTPAPSSSPSSRPLDFRLPPPADDGRSPGVQGPSDNGLPPVAPGERRGQPAPAPAPTPTPTQPAVVPRVTPTQPTTVTTPAPARRDQPATATARATPAPNDPAPSESAATEGPALSPLETTAAPVASPAPAAAPDDAPVLPAPATSSSDTPVWMWLLAAFAALGAGFWYWRRRAALAGPALDEVEEAPRPVPPRPATRTSVPPPKPVAPPAPPQPQRASAPQPEPQVAHPLVTRPAAEQRAIIGMALDIRSIRFAPDHVAVGFALNLLNQGTVPATGLMVRIALNQGSAMPEPVLARFFDGAGGSVLRDDMALDVGAGEELSTEVMLPRASIEPLMIGGKPMLVPVIAFDVTYHWDGEGEAFGQNAGSFVLGREQGASGSDKLAPLTLERASYTVDRPAARATAIKRAQ